jgi:hypothetical protein
MINVMTRRCVLASSATALISMSFRAIAGPVSTIASGVAAAINRSPSSTYFSAKLALDATSVPGTEERS